MNSLVQFVPVTENEKKIKLGFDLLSITIEDMNAELSKRISEFTVPTVNLANRVLAGSGITVTDNGNGTITITAPGTGFVTGTGTATHVPYWTGANTLGSSSTFTFTPSTGSGTDTTLQLYNPNGTSGHDSIMKLVVNSVNGGQPKIIFDTNDSYASAHIGMPRGGARYIGFGRGEDAESLNVVQIFTETHKMRVNGQVDIITNSIDGSAQVVKLVVSQNISGAATGPAIIECNVAGPNKDPSFQLYTGKNGTGSVRFIMGMDNSDSSTLKLGFTTASGEISDVSATTQFMNVTTAGIISFLKSTDASAVGTASITLAGGLGVAKKLYLGDDLYLTTGKAYRVNGVQVLTNQQAGLGANISAATAGAAYGATEQAMLQALNDKLVALEPMLKTHGLVAT